MITSLVFVTVFIRQRNCWLCSVTTSLISWSATDIIKQIKPLTEATRQTFLPHYYDSPPFLSLCTCSDQTCPLLSGPAVPGVRVAKDAASHALRNSTETEPQSSPGHWATSCPSCLTISILWHCLLLTDKHLPRQPLGMISRTALENNMEKAYGSLCHMPIPDTAPTRYCPQTHLGSPRHMTQPLWP